MVLNGAGTRVKIIYGYVCRSSLFGKKKSANANEIMNSKEAAAIKLNIVSGLITSDKMVSAINEGLRIQPERKQLH